MSEEVTRVHVTLPKSLHVWLKDHFGDTVGVSGALRTMAETLRKNVEAKAQAKMGEEL